MKRYAKRLYFATLALVGDENDAWDISQEAFVRVLRNLKRIDENRGFYPYLYRTMRNLVLKRGKTKEGFAELEVSSPEEELERKEKIEEVRRVLSSLPPEAREIIYLRHFEGLPYRKIAEILGIPEGTVMSRLHHARKKLLKLLEENETS